MPMPMWVLDTHGTFPEERYFAELGSGRTADAAKNNAAKELTAYLETKIQNEIQINEMDAKNIVSSNLSLLSLKYTVPYNSKKERLFYTVCFLDRNESLNQLIPEIETAKENYELCLKNAEEENDSVSKVSLSDEALVKANELFSKLCFLQILNPSAYKDFEDLYIKIANIKNPSYNHFH